MHVCYLQSDLWAEELPANLYFMRLLTVNTPLHMNDVVGGLVLYN